MLIRKIRTEQKSYTQSETTMKIRTLALAIVAASCAASLAGAAEPAPTETTAPAAVPQPSPPPATKKAGQGDEVFIRLKAPLFSPLFAGVPLATVNEEPITVEDLKGSLGTIHQGITEGQAVHRQNFPELLKRLVNALLIIQEARNMELDKLPEIKQAVDDFSEKLRRETLLKDEVKNIKADEKEIEKQYQSASAEYRLTSLIIDKLEDVKKFEDELKSGKKFDTLSERYIKEGRAREGGKSSSFLTRDVIPPTMLKDLEKMKPGELSKPLPLEKGYMFYRVEEVRHRDDPALKEQVRQEQDTKARVTALEALQERLIKKYVTQDKYKKVFDKLDFENPKVKFETFLKDKRAIADVQGEKAVTVADLAEAIANKYYHGVERAAEGKKINKEKRAILNELLGTIVLNKEARVRGIEDREEYRRKVRGFSNSLLFGTFVNKVVRPDITVTADELQAYYKQHATEYTTMEAYRLDAIAFETPALAEQAVAKLATGADFKWLKANGEGRTGIGKAFYNLFEGDAIAKTNLPEQLQKSLEGAKTGDYRFFKDNDRGYAIAVQELLPARIRSYQEVEEAVKEAVFYQKLNQGIENWANKLKSSSDVIIYADFAP